MKASWRTVSGWVIALSLAAIALGRWVSGPPAGRGEAASPAPVLGHGVDRVPVPRGHVHARDAWFLGQRAYPLAAIPAGALPKAQQQRRRLPAKAGSGTLFTPAGPAGFTSTVAPAWGRMSGRTRDLAIDPTNPDRMFLATASGGVWRTTDGGSGWMPLTDAQASLATSAVALGASDPGTVYAGTGEGPGGAYFGVGILKSTDGGDSWTLRAGDTFARHAISELLVDPADSATVLACSTFGRHTPGDFVPPSPGSIGVFRSTDGGDSFVQTLGPAFCEELVADPSDFSRLYASVTGYFDSRDGIYRSTDGGVSFTQLAGGGAPAETGRLAIGISADGATLYAGGKDFVEVTRIWKSADGGATWSRLDATPDYCEFQCFYDNVIAVAPGDPAVAYFGGVPLYRTTDGGQSFEQLGDSNDSAVRPLHVDHHVLEFQPGGSSILYDGNDGGIYRSADAQAARTPLAKVPDWSSIGGSLATLQVYDLALHPTDAGIMLAGFQDNGTQLRGAGGWSERCGGDGGYALIDHADPATMYCSFATFGDGEIPIQKSTDGGVSFPADASVPAFGERTAFIAPLVMDPAAPATLYAGTQRLWRSTDGGASWAPRSSSADLTGGSGTISRIAIAPSAPNVLWLVTSDGRVQVSTDSGVDFTDATRAPLPGRFATSVAVDPADPAVAWVGFSGFDDATPGAPGHVFRTTDAGAAWADVTGALPDTPVNAIAVRPDRSSEIYAGTDVGVFLSADAGGTWAAMTAGIPNAPVIDIEVNAATDLLAVATHGRGVFTARLSSMDPPGECSGTVCLNGGRFQVDAQWRTPAGQTGTARLVPGMASEDSAVLYFFSPDNWEMLVKVLDGCAVNGRTWVFAASATDLGYTLMVVETDSGRSREYTNPAGRAAPAITDTAAFETCP